MRVVIGAFNWIRSGGVETYATTLAEGLLRLGHDVVIHPQEHGPLTERTRARGLVVTAGEDDLPADADALIANDDVSAFALAARYPSVPLLFVTHSSVFDTSVPPRVPGVVSAVVVLNDLTAAHVRACASDAPVLRLRQPVDADHFAPDAPARPRARRVLSLGHYLRGESRSVLERACELAGLELRLVGAMSGTAVDDPLAELLAADIVVGCGRCVLEAMACGRAAFVYDWHALGGWVTPESYPALEASGFTGRGTGTTSPVRPTPEALAEALAGYDPRMSRDNAELAQAHHRVQRHAREIVGALEDLGARRAAPSDGLREMAWLARHSWLSEARAYAAGTDALRAREEAEALRAERDAAIAGREALAAQAGALRGELAVARRDLEAAARVTGSRRWRLAERLARPLDALRGR